MEVMKQGGSLNRRAAVHSLLHNRKETLVIAGLGSSAYDLHAAGDNEANFYLWGAMGGAAMVGLGLALAQPERPVLVITGDGEQLMGLGALATIGVQKPANFTLAVLDNGHFGETGMQRSHTSQGVDLSAVAIACGFAWLERIETLEEIDGLRARIQMAQGPGFALISVEATNLERSLPPRDGVFLKNRFRQHLGWQVQ